MTNTKLLLITNLQLHIYLHKAQNNKTKKNNKEVSLYYFL